jgi:sugar lactone lactonase YvrE
MGERSLVTSGSRRPSRRVARRQAVALALAGLLLLLVTATALAVTGDLSQPAGTAGCISRDGAGPCADGHALINPNSVAVSPDGKNVYVASVYGHAVVRINRSTTTGAITQPVGRAGCVSETGAGACADGHALSGAYSVGVSPDGKSVYVASNQSGAVARFQRGTTYGAITQPAGTAGCISDTGAGPCADGHALQGANSVAVSPDGKSVYVASRRTQAPLSDAVARLIRNTTTGAISQPAGPAGCVSETGAGTCADGHALDGAKSVAVSPDGKSVYVASQDSDAVTSFTRNTTTGAISQPAGTAGCVSETGAGNCADGHALDGVYSVAVSPDGKSVYAASVYGSAVVHFNRNTTTGAITQPAGTAGCVSETGTGPCADGHALDGPFGVVVSPDGKSVYVASLDSHAVARFDRSLTTGAIMQPAGTTGCVSQTGAGTCADGHALNAPNSVTVSPDGMSVYATSDGINAVARFNRAP